MKTINKLSISESIKFLIQISASFYILKKIYPTYYNFFYDYFSNVTEQISLSTYLYYFDKLSNHTNITITLLNIPSIIYLIYQYESNKRKEKKLKDNATMLYNWSTEFNKKYN